MSNRSITLALLGLALLSFPAQAHAATVITSIALDDVAVRPGVTADVQLTIHRRAGRPCDGATALLIPGAGAGGATLDRLADALLEDHPFDRELCRAITLDLPGHGASSLPVGARFGDLSIDDYAGTVLSTLTRLRQLGLRTTTLVGHSMGGGAIMRVQQRLLDQGSSLRAIGVGDVLLLAPAIPAGSPWALRDLGLASVVMAPFHVSDPLLGEVLSLPLPYALALTFGTPSGTIPDGVVTEEILALAEDATGPESWNVMAGTLNLGGGEPLTVSRGAFASFRGTRLDVVAFTLDTLVWPSDATSLFAYLTAGHAARADLTIIDTPDAVHGMPISNPEGMLELIADDGCGR